MELWQILTIVFGILASYFAYHWNKTKSVIGKIGVLFTIIYDALKDNKLTEEELKEIVDQIMMVIDEFKDKKNVSVETLENAKDKVKMIKNKKR